MSNHYTFQIYDAMQLDEFYTEAAIDDLVVDSLTITWDTGSDSISGGQIDIITPAERPQLEAVLRRVTGPAIVPTLQEA